MYNANVLNVHLPMICFSDFLKLKQLFLKVFLSACIIQIRHVVNVHLSMKTIFMKQRFDIPENDRLVDFAVSLACLYQLHGLVEGCLVSSVKEER